MVSGIRTKSPPPKEPYEEDGWTIYEVDEHYKQWCRVINGHEYSVMTHYDDSITCEMMRQGDFEVLWYKEVPSVEEGKQQCLRHAETSIPGA